MVRCLLRARLLAFALVPLLAACAATVPAPKSMGDPELPYAPARAPKVGDFLHLASGFYVPEDAVMEALTYQRVVFVGETHDNPASHRLEIAVLERMAEARPGAVALGMEMFTPSQQEALDRWVAGELSEKEFLEASGWYDAWGGDYGLYRGLLDTAKRLGVPVIALNAERSLVKTLVMKTVEELPDELRATVPEMDLDDPYQRAMVTAVFGDHAHGSGDASGFVRVQTLWDEAMAENTAHYLREHPESSMVVVAGGNHVRYGFGIPRRVFRRIPVAYAIIGSQEIEMAPEKQAQMMDVTFPEYPMRAYDYVAYTAYEDAGAKPASLGTMVELAAGAEPSAGTELAAGAEPSLGAELAAGNAPAEAAKPAEGRVVVSAVMPLSAAEAAGIAVGDVLLRIDETELHKPFDLVYEVKQRRVGDSATLTIERAGTILTIEVTFTEPKHHG